jgi:hypothetical protein
MNLDTIQKVERAIGALTPREIEECIRGLNAVSND